jgi:ArsR family transcriptional regulator
MPLPQTAKALADESRIRILAALRLGELSVGEIVQALGLGQSRVSRHLNILAAAGLVASRRDGRWVFYALPESGPGRAFLDAAFTLADSEAAFEADRRAVEDVLAARARETRRFFDAVAENWPSMRDESLGGFDLPGALAHMMPLVDTAADLGCGGGETLARMAPKAGALIGVDSSPGMLETARQLLGKDADLRLGDLSHLPMPDHEAGLAVMSLVLHHLSDPSAALREACRVLAPGGNILVAEFDAHSKEEMRSRFGDRRLGFEPEEIRNRLLETGFRQVRREAHELESELVLSIYTAEKPQHDGGQ